MKIFLIFYIIFLLFIYIDTQESSIISKGFEIIKNITKINRNSIKIPNIKDIYDNYFYNKREILKIAVKNLYSYKNQIPYDYTYLDLCPPPNISRPKEGITELITGQRMSYSNYFIFMNQNETCNLLCVKNFTNEEKEKYEWLIKRKYAVTYYLDKLPSGFLKSQKILNQSN